MVYDIIAYMDIDQQEVDRFVTDQQIDVTDWALSIAKHSFRRRYSYSFW